MIALRRTVQSYVEFSLSPLDESGFPTTVNNTFLSFRIRDKNCKSKVRNEESCGVINPSCVDTAYRCGYSRGAAAERYPQNRVPVARSTSISFPRSRRSSPSATNRRRMNARETGAKD
jgi:hypothetical protein